VVAGGIIIVASVLVIIVAFIVSRSLVFAV
jgi:hypothetical protein